MSDLRLRVLSALALAPLVLALAWIGGWWFVTLMALVAGVVACEWSGIVRARPVDAAALVGAAGAAGAVLLFAAGVPAIAMGALAAGAVAGRALARRDDPGDDPARLLWPGVLYAGLPALGLVALRGDAGLGIVAIAYLVAIVWATDIGAYFVGRLVGGPKLWPAVSPRKTWSGALGGLACGVAAAAAVLALAGIPAAVPVALAAVLSVASQAGDLAESALKRRFGVKDASRLIPGHGGLMDRVDGLFAAALLAGAVGLGRGGADAAGAGLLLW